MDITLGFLTRVNVFLTPMSKLLSSPLDNNIKKKNYSFFLFIPFFKK